MSGPVVVENVRLEVGEPEERLPARAAERLGVSAEALEEVAVCRRALDARRKSDIHWTLSLAVRLREAAIRADLLRRGAAKEPGQPAKSEVDRAILGASPTARAPSRPRRS